MSLVDARTFRTDARLRLWGAGVVALFAITATALEYTRQVQPLLAGSIAAVLVVWALWLVATYVVHRSVVYRLSPQRIEVEKGLLGRRFETVELWRVRDVALDQTLFERMRGVGRVTLISSDALEPSLQIGPVTDAKSIYSDIRDAIAAARREAHVMPIDAGA